MMRCYTDHGGAISNRPSIIGGRTRLLMNLEPGYKVPGTQTVQPGTGSGPVLCAEIAAAATAQSATVDARLLPYVQAQRC